MTKPIILATSSEIRIQTFNNAGIPVGFQPARIDESAIKSALLSEGAKPRDIADTLAEHKARKVALKNTDAIVIGFDQILELGGSIFSKPETPDDAADQLNRLSGQRHNLYSAGVIYENGSPVWRHVGHVKMSVRTLSEELIADYVERNWESIRHCVGCYKLEEEGIRLFHRIDGDYFHVLGLPFLELLNYLADRKMILG